jgi:hypothetical protein
MNFLEILATRDDISQMQTIDKHFRKLTETVFKKHGFAQGDVLAHWPQIVGMDMAAITAPEKIRWPRGSEDMQGGTLHVRVSPGRALDVQYSAQAIADKVNSFLGYRAIAALKLTHAHGMLRPAKLKTVPPDPTPAVVARVAQVEDADLQAALSRLGARVAAATPRSPQAK